MIVYTIFIEYILLICYLFCVLLLGIFLFAISWVFSKGTLGRRRFAIYECGFRALGGSYKPFTVQYFMLAFLFLLFDIELLFIFPWLGVYSGIFTIKSFIVIWFFSLLLVLGFLYEISKGSLGWYSGTLQNLLKKKIYSNYYN